MKVFLLNLVILLLFMLSACSTNDEPKNNYPSISSSSNITKINKNEVIATEEDNENNEDRIIGSEEDIEIDTDEVITTSQDNKTDEIITTQNINTKLNDQNKLINNVEENIESNSSTEDNVLKPIEINYDQKNNTNFFGLWEFSDFNTQDNYKILIYNMKETRFDFEFYNYNYTKIDGVMELKQYGFNGSATMISDNIFTFKIDDSSMIDYYSSSIGKIQFKDNELQISFSYESYDKLHTIKLNKVADDQQIIQKINNIPFYERELKIEGQYLNKISLSNAYKIFGKPLKTVQEEFYENDYKEIRTYDGFEVTFSLPTEYSSSSNIIKMTITKPGISIIRGIQVGDDIKDVINKFPNEGYQLIELNGKTTLPLYGLIQHMNSFGQVIYENKKPIRVIYSDSSYLIIEVDENSKVSSISTY